jgi:DASS family divalent anion:Na+ symporter
VAVSVILWSGLLTFTEAFDAFTDRTVWLIVSALLMAEAVEKTGLGCRLSLLFISAVGGTPLGLTYALMGADLVLAMGMPSTTAREGGVFLSILRGICQAYGSYPGEPPGWSGACSAEREGRQHRLSRPFSGLRQ